MVVPDLMESPQAQFIRTAQEIDVGNRGKALWMFLGSRLRSLINIQKVWGEVQTLYESRDASIYESVPLRNNLSFACDCSDRLLVIAPVACDIV
jgi:hypothetical protein